MPEDIDALRERLAYRIEAFVKSREDEADAFGDDGGETGAAEGR